MVLCTWWPGGWAHSLTWTLVLDSLSGGCGSGLATACVSRGGLGAGASLLTRRQVLSRVFLSQITYGGWGLVSLKAKFILSFSDLMQLLLNLVLTFFHGSWSDVVTL